MAKTIEERFEDLLCEKGDEVDNSAYALAVAIMRNNPAVPVQEMAQDLMNAIALNTAVTSTHPTINTLIEKTKKILTSQGYQLDETKVIGMDISDEKILEWNMSYIGEMDDIAEGLLADSGVETCRPFYEGDDETPCYLGEDCEVKNCPLKAKR